tara:strand:+ start:361 stop:564 length:204 start_codon:yes stop_codon:yes gene_type:complete
MTFKEVQQKLAHSECLVTFQSLKSNKQYTRLYTIPRVFQKDSDKILVWDVADERWEDIQVDTILAIE